MIYYVEDDDNIRELVIYTLKQSGFAAQGFAASAPFFAAVQRQCPQLVLLDIMLPHEDGIAILRRLRESAETQKVPVMMITARTAEYDKVMGLDAGADDYLTKPFGMMELIARVKALLRRAGSQAGAQVLTASELSLDIARHEVLAGGRPVVLTHKEFELLRCLMENRKIVLSRERLLETVWGYDYVGGSRTVDVHIQTLRQKLGPCGLLIETVRGVGYRFGG